MKLGDFVEEKTCKLCGSNMELMKGRFGYFWGCTKFPKCKFTLDADLLKEPLYYDNTFLKPADFIKSDFKNRVIELLLSSKISDNFRSRVLLELELFNENLLKSFDFGKHKFHSLLDFLHKVNATFLKMNFCYFIYELNNKILPDSYTYFLTSFYEPNSYARAIKHKERQIRDSIVHNWELTPFYKDYGYKLIGPEVALSKYINKNVHDRVDILAAAENSLVVIEIKGVTIKGTQAIKQLLGYKELLKTKDYNVLCYIVSKGCMTHIIEGIGNVGYVVDNEYLSLIPWRESILY